MLCGDYLIAPFKDADDEWNRHWNFKQQFMKRIQGFFFSQGDAGNNRIVQEFLEFPAKLDIFQYFQGFSRSSRISRNCPKILSRFQKNQAFKKDLLKF